MQRRNFLTATLIATACTTAAKPFDWIPVGAKGFVLKSGKNRFNETTHLIGDSPIDIKVSGADTGGQLSIGEYTGYVKGGPPLHIHPNQDEVFYILEGEHLFQLGEERFHLTAGDTIFIPRGTPHAPAQVSEKGKYLYFFTPSGKMEDFFRALSALKKNATSADAAKLFEQHDMKIVGPPLTF